MISWVYTRESMCSVNLQHNISNINKGCLLNQLNIVTQ